MYIGMEVHKPTGLILIGKARQGQVGSQELHERHGADDMVAGAGVAGPPFSQRVGKLRVDRQRVSPLALGGLAPQGDLDKVGAPAPSSQDIRADPRWTARGAAGGNGCRVGLLRGRHLSEQDDSDTVYQQSRTAGPVGIPRARLGSSAIRGRVPEAKGPGRR